MIMLIAILVVSIINLAFLCLLVHALGEMRGDISLQRKVLADVWKKQREMPDKLNAITDSINRIASGLADIASLCSIHEKQLDDIYDEVTEQREMYDQFINVHFSLKEISMRFVCDLLHVATVIDGRDEAEINKFKALYIQIYGEEDWDKMYEMEMITVYGGNDECGEVPGVLEGTPEEGVDGEEDSFEPRIEYDEVQGVPEAG